MCHTDPRGRAASTAVRPTTLTAHVKGLCVLRHTLFLFITTSRLQEQKMIVFIGTVGQVT